MKEPSAIKRLQRRILPGLALISALLNLSPTLGHGAFADNSEKGVMLVAFQPKDLLAVATTPKYLVIEPAPTARERESKEEDSTITPFIGADRALTPLPTPERPAIVTNDGTVRETPEFTAGVLINMGTFNFNLGYTLPAAQVDNFVRPLGVNIDSGTDIKRFSLGVKIPF